MCEQCREKETEIQKPKLHSPVKDEDKQRPCIICLRNSDGEVIVFESVCDKEGHAVPLAQSYRSDDLHPRQVPEEPNRHFANTHSYQDVESKFRRD